MKEDKASWVGFFQWLLGRGLDGVKLVIGDKCLEMLEAAGKVFPEAKYQRCTVHFYRNVFSVVPRSKGKTVAQMLKVIYAQESKKAAREKAKAVVAELQEMKLKEAAKKVENSIEETLTYYDFPSEHWPRIRTNNIIERLNREIRRRTRVVSIFPDGNSALMLVCARLHHMANTQWGNKKYMNMKHLEQFSEIAIEWKIWYNSSEVRAMLHNEARNLLVEAYEKTHDAKGIALAYGVSVPTVYRQGEQKAKTGSVDLRVSERGRKRVLGPKTYEQIVKMVDEQPDITLAEIVEKLELPVGIETVRRSLVAMGYRCKKKMIHTSEQGRPRCAGQICEENAGISSGFSG